MKYIEKREQPYNLDDWIEKKPNLNYENLTKKRKKTIRKKLLEDQGYICCYCQKRITGIQKDGHRDAEIEHIKPQSNCNDRETVSYDNLLVSCDGNQKRDNKLLKEHDRHCNNFRQDKNLYINLLDRDCENKIYYDFNGGIYAVNNNLDVKETINNLNLRILNSTRKAYIDGFSLFDLSNDDIDTLNDYFSNKFEENEKQMYCEYAGVMINLLNQLG